jgi:hypothetical protein
MALWPRSDTCKKTKFIKYKYLMYRLGKKIHNFHSQHIHTIYLPKAFILYQNKNTFLFLEFIFFDIYYIFSL